MTVVAFLPVLSTSHGGSVMPIRRSSTSFLGRMQISGPLALSCMHTDSQREVDSGASPASSASFVLRKSVTGSTQRPNAR